MPALPTSAPRNRPQRQTREQRTAALRERNEQRGRLLPVTPERKPLPEGWVDPFLPDDYVETAQVSEETSLQITEVSVVVGRTVVVNGNSTAFEVGMVAQLDAADAEAGVAPPAVADNLIEKCRETIRRQFNPQGV